MFYLYRILTLHIENDPLGHRGRYSIGGDAQIGAHFIPAHFAQRQDIAIVHENCCFPRGYGFGGGFSEHGNKHARFRGLIREFISYILQMACYPKVIALIRKTCH